MANELKFASKVVFSSGIPLTLPIAASDPGSGVNGDLYFNSTSNLVRLYFGGTWHTVQPDAISALTGDVSASGPGSAAATVNSVGGSSAANINSAELAANAATSANTASTIVKRDASGNFTAGIITADLTGAASANVLKAGDTMTGALDMGSNKITSTYVPLNAADLTNKSYVDAQISAGGQVKVSAADTGSQYLSASIVPGAALSSTILNPGANETLSIDVNVDNSTIEVDTDALRLKALGITNSHISASAAIDFSKLASLSSGNILVGNGSGVATSVAMSGEASISNAGAVTLSNAAVIGKVLTGYVSGAGVISASDSILSAIQKLNGNDGNFALRTLNNLSSVAINISLLPATDDNSINLGSQTLRYSSLFSVDARDLNNEVVIDFNARQLQNNVSGLTLEWATPGTMTSYASIVPDADGTRVLGANTFAWNTLFVQQIRRSASSPYIDMGNGILTDSTSNSSVDWQSRRLKDSAGGIQLDWATAGTLDSRANLIFNTGATALVKTMNDSAATKALILSSGNSSGANSGAVNLQSGTGGVGSFNSGNVNIASGDADLSSGTSGDISLTVGAGSTLGNVNISGGLNVTFAGMNLTGTGNIAPSVTDNFNFGSGSLRYNRLFIKEIMKNASEYAIKIDPRQLVDSGGFTSVDWELRHLMDSAGAQKISFAGPNIDMHSSIVENVTDPTSPQHAATKAYVDNLTAGLSWKQAVIVASVADVSVATAPASIDGVTLSSGNRVLLKDQTAPAENGIYIFNGAGNALTRSSDADTWNEVVAATVYVEEGTVNAYSKWVDTNVAGGTLGTTAVTFALFSAASALTGSGTAGYAAYWSASSNLTAEQYLSPLRGGLGADASAFTGVVKASGGVFSASALVNSDVDVAAAIAYSKLNLTGSIVNADIASGAAIAFSKLASLASGHIIAGNGGVATDVLMSGEASIDNTGAVTLSNAAVIGKLLTGYTSGAGTISASDSILSAIQKLNGNDGNFALRTLNNLTTTSINADLLPSASGTKNIGSISLKWDQVHANSLHADYIKDASGNVAMDNVLRTLNDSTGSAQMLFNNGGTVLFYANIVPQSDLGNDIGTSSARWANAYVPNIFSGASDMSLNANNGSNVLNIRSSAVKRGTDGTNYVTEKYTDSSTLTDNTSSSVAAFAFAIANFAGEEIEYVIEGGTAGAHTRIGKIMVTCSNSGTPVVSLSDMFSESADLGVSWSAAESGGTVTLSYTASNQGANRTMRADVKSFRR
jgi:hypothetical protein